MKSLFVLLLPASCLAYSKHFRLRTTRGIYGGDSLRAGRGIRGSWRSRLFSSSQHSEQQHYTLEYSSNFRRHIVRKNGAIVKSFAWLDEALDAYPYAERKPIPCSATGDVLPVAGGGLASKEDRGYPISKELISNRNLNEIRIRVYLEETLGWFPGQVESLLRSCPHIFVWPEDIVRERIDFLLSPLPGKNAVAEVNATVIDWPLQYYEHKRGAGMSVAQLSHALTLLPNLLFRDLETDTVRGSPISPVTMCRLYEETPAVVLDLTQKQLDALYGASNFDSVAYSHLHWKGWEFHQIRVLLQAFPGCIKCSEEAGWELFDRGSTPRKTLRLDAMEYLQLRLQLGPSHLQAILKTHSQLSHYFMHQLQRNCDALQENLKLSSNELRTLVLRMPSVLGMSVESINKRIVFWTKRVGLSVAELKQALSAQPSLIQYGLETNLEPKLRFFVELSLSKHDIRRFSVRHPQLWGRSLDHHWRPLCSAFCYRCANMTTDEFGTIIRRAPELAKCNWKRNLSVKIEYLANRLLLTPLDVKKLVLKEPRVLLHSVSGSLEPKIDLLLDEFSVADSRVAILQIPSLLIVPYASLRERMDRVRILLSREKSLTVTLGKAKRQRRPARAVCLLSDDGESGQKNFASVNDAAIHAGISKSHMYNLLRKGQPIGRKKYVFVGNQRQNRTHPVYLLSADGNSVEKEFASVNEAASHAGISKSYMYSILRDGRTVGKRQYVYPGTQRKRYTSETSSLVKSAPVAEKATSQSAAEGSLKRDVERLVTLEPRPRYRLVIHVCARAYPQENTLRGRRRAGGMALFVPSWSPQDWKRVVFDLWKGRSYRLLNDGKTLLLGYPYTRPSRARCSLYACREALRAARSWINDHYDVLHSTSNAVEIEIVTDSNPCLERVENSTMLEEWADATTLDEILQVAPSNYYQTSPDILYPLAKTYAQLTRGNYSSVISNVVFRKDNNVRLGEGAMIAARLMYDSIK